MTQKTTTPEPKASSTWERLEHFVREHVQRFIQALLEEEVTELLGRTKSARREAVAAPSGYRNGYGKPWRCTIADGHLGLGAALGEQYPQLAEQRCWNHKITNVLDALPKKYQAEARTLRCALPYAETQAAGEALIALATEQGFPYWLALGTILHGWALAEQGQGEKGIAQIRQGIAA